MTGRPNEDRRERAARPATNPAPPRRGYQRQSLGEAMAKSFIRSIASSLGRIIARAITRRGR
jgi:hypothetical protein